MSLDEIVGTLNAAVDFMLKDVPHKFRIAKVTFFCTTNCLLLVTS